ncbi:MAG: HD domain-containing protein [Planctomycetes bacterium]|nr:HD domain-containing protein [Planctomycetota bacterium]
MCLIGTSNPERGPKTVDERISALVDELATTAVNARIYHRDHPRVRLAAESARELLAELGAQRSVRLSIADELLVFEGQPLIGVSMTATRLIDGILGWGAGGFELDARATADDLVDFLQEIARKPPTGDSWERLNERFIAKGRPCMKLLAPFVHDAAGTGVGAAGTGPSFRVPMRFYQGCIGILQDLTIAICHGEQLDLGPVRQQAERVLAELGAGPGELVGLARHDQYDAFTFGHSVRVGVLAMSFARRLTDDHDLLVRIGSAALLHDCGKALIPFEILHARRALTQDERVAMQRHSQLGAELLLDQGDADLAAVATAFGHHRSCNGGGYPAMLSAFSSMPVVEIVKICDVYEALTAKRPYKLPMSPIRAYRLMISMGQHFDQALLRHFIELNGIYPSGMQVTLSTGARAEVIAQSRMLLAPQVRILSDREGNELREEDRSVIDLSDPCMLDRVTVTGAVTDRTPLAR